MVAAGKLGSEVFGEQEEVQRGWKWGTAAPTGQRSLMRTHL